MAARRRTASSCFLAKLRLSRCRRDRPAGWLAGFSVGWLVDWLVGGWGGGLKVGFCMLFGQWIFGLVVWVDGLVAEAGQVEPLRRADMLQQVDGRFRGCLVL